MPFTPVSRRRVADEIADRIRDAILAGRYAPGDHLPSERALADQFSVNRSSVREALRRLDTWGLVAPKHGGGNRVTAFLTTAGLQLLPHLLAPGGQVDVGLVRDLLEVRVVLLGLTAALAAARHDDEELARLQAALTRLDAADTAEARQEADFAFFSAMVDATHNRVIALVVNAIRDVYAKKGDHFIALYHGDFTTTPHHDTLAAIAARDSGTARRAMAEYGLLGLNPFGGTDATLL